MKVYLDNSATTALDERVLKKMLPFFCDNYGNASSAHSFGRDALFAVDTARNGIASLLGCLPTEIYFTSGGTESDNWAIRGVAAALRDKGKHLITTRIEHPAILSACHYLESQGYDVTYIDVDKDGFVKTEDIEKAIRPDTILVSVMMANNEIGTIQPIAQICNLCHQKNILCHTDAVQAVGNIEISLLDLNVDLLSFSSHKFHGPKGVGVLYVRKGTPIDNLLFGGEQERGKRSGTLNTPGIVGTEEALRISLSEMNETIVRVAELRDIFLKKVFAEIPGCHINGGENRLPGNINLTIEGVKADLLLTALDRKGIAASSGSACAAGTHEPSHVLLAIGRTPEEAKCSLRFGFGKNNTLKETEYAADVLIESVKKIRDSVALFKIIHENGTKI